MISVTESFIFEGKDSYYVVKVSFGSSVLSLVTTPKDVGIFYVHLAPNDQWKSFCIHQQAIWAVDQRAAIVAQLIAFYIPKKYSYVLDNEQELCFYNDSSKKENFFAKLDCEKKAFENLSKSTQAPAINDYLNRIDAGEIDYSANSFFIAITREYVEKDRIIKAQISAVLKGSDQILNKSLNISFDVPLFAHKSYLFQEKESVITQYLDKIHTWRCRLRVEVEASEISQLKAYFERRKSEH